MASTCCAWQKLKKNTTNRSTLTGKQYFCAGIVSEVREVKKGVIEYECFRHEFAGRKDY